jgi:hypothetical protein
MRTGTYEEPAQPVSRSTLLPCIAPLRRGSGHPERTGKGLIDEEKRLRGAGFQMKRDDSDWVSDLFAAGARDWTPVSARRLTCSMHRFRAIPRYQALRISPVGRRTAEVDSFLTEDGKAQFQQRRAFRRYCGARVLGSPRPLSQITFKRQRRGVYLPVAKCLL